MRTLAILLVISTVALAQDDGGAALFYKGFWLEQAEGKLDEAAALYGKLLSEQPDAAEAPRALLGLVRIKIAKGEDASELVAELERRYPDAKEEIATARKVAVREELDLERRPDDSPVAEKLKSLLKQGAWADEDRLFLIDLGSAAHPMLARLLRATTAGEVQRAADVLVWQRTPEAYAVLASALLDDTALFRSTIVAEVSGIQEAPPAVVDALGKLFERSAPRLRAEIVAALAVLADYGSRERAFATLTRALADSDESVRQSAMGAVGNAGVTDAYLEALLRLYESAGTEVPSFVAPFLLRFADRAAFRGRIEKIVGTRYLEATAVPFPLPEEGAVMLARILVRNHAQGRGAHSVLVTKAARSSPRAASLLLRAAIETGDDVFAKIDMGGDPARRHLGEEADRIRAAAVAAAEGLGEEKVPNADRELLEVVGVAEQDFPSILEGLRGRGKRSFPSVLLRKEWLFALGPAKAGELVQFCTSERDVHELLSAGKDFARREDAGIEFYRQVVPRTGPGVAGYLSDLAALPALVPLVVDRFLAADGAEWGWGARLRSERGGFMVGDRQYIPRDEAASRYPGPYAWRTVQRAALRDDACRAKLLGHAGDKRPEIAITVAAAAEAEKGDVGTAALRALLQSDTPEVREIALGALLDRAADGPSLVREFARRGDLADADRRAVEGALRRGTAYGPLAAELLKLGTWPGLWPVYQQIAPKECVELALAEAVRDRDGEHRRGAVRVLAEVEDPRRIEAFRKVLSGTDRPAVFDVLSAVRDQYLVELGEETLAHLRNPDPGIRQVATEAIDKLKFYAEAKKAFEK